MSGINEKFLGIDITLPEYKGMNLVNFGSPE